jgi:hypothetical protein
VREREFRAEDSQLSGHSPSLPILAGPGCYAFQVDEADFRKAIVSRRGGTLESKPNHLRDGGGEAQASSSIFAMDGAPVCAAATRRDASRGSGLLVHLCGRAHCLRNDRLK